MRRKVLSSKILSCLEIKPSCTVYNLPKRLKMSVSDEEEQEQLTEEQIKIFRQHFDNFDLKQQGAIDASDLGTVLRACGQIPTEGWLKERMKVNFTKNKMTSKKS